MNQQISDGQCYALNKLIDQFAPTPECRLYIIRRLVAKRLLDLRKDVNDTADLTVAEWQHIRNEAYPNWQQDDWKVAPAFKSKILALVNRYSEEELGQQRLF